MKKEDIPYRETQHLLHFILSVLFFPWIIIWMIRYTCNTNYNQSLDKELWLLKVKLPDTTEPHPDSYTTNIDGNNDYK